MLSYHNSVLSATYYEIKRNAQMHEGLAQCILCYSALVLRAFKVAFYRKKKTSSLGKRFCPVAGEKACSLLVKDGLVFGEREVMKAGID